MTDGYSLLVEYGIRALRIMVLAFGGYWVVEAFARRIRQQLTRVYPDELRLELITRVFSYMMFFVIGVAISHELGLNITAFLGAAGIVGIALGYAAQTSMANIISGLFLMVEHPFEIGDEIIINEIEGRVAAVNLFAVTLKTPSNTMVRVPQEQLLKNSFTNLTRLPFRRYNFSITIETKHDVIRVMHSIEKVIALNSYCSHDRTPLLELTHVYGYTYTLAVGVWGPQAHFAAIKKHVPLELKAALEREGIILAAFSRGHDKGSL